MLGLQSTDTPRIALELFLGDPVNVLWFVPISEEERQVAIAQGSEHLASRLPLDRWKTGMTTTPLGGGAARRQLWVLAVGKLSSVCKGEKALPPDSRGEASAPRPRESRRRPEEQKSPLSSPFRRFRTA